MLHVHTNVRDWRNLNLVASSKSAKLRNSMACVPLYNSSHSHHTNSRYIPKLNSILYLSQASYLKSQEDGYFVTGSYYLYGRSMCYRMTLYSHRTGKQSLQLLNRLVT